MVCNTPLASCPGCVLSPSLAHPQHSGPCGGWRARLSAVPALLGKSQNTGVRSGLLWLQVQSTALYGLLWGNLTPPQSEPAQQAFEKNSNGLILWWQAIPSLRLKLFYTRTESTREINSVVASHFQICELTTKITNVGHSCWKDT